MKTARRIAFAVPFVVTVACDRPIEHRAPKIREPREDSRNSRSAPPVPEELVETLVPLAPRPPVVEGAASRAEPITTRIRAIQRGVVRTRVRTQSSSPIDDSWRVVFVTRDQVEMGECTIVEWDMRELECTTMLTPEQLVVDHETVRVRISPPPLDDIAARRAEMQSRPPACCTNPPLPQRWPRTPLPPTANPPPPQRARVLKTESMGTDVVLTVSMGSDRGVARSWSAQIVTVDGSPVQGGDCTIIRVDKRTTVCKVKLTVDQVKASPYVLLSP